MDNDIKHTTDLYRLVAWAHARRKQLILITASVAVVVAIVGIYIWHKNYNESRASEALSQLAMPTGPQDTTATAADPYLKLANDFDGTTAAGRALLTAGGLLFDANKFADAQSQFERFLSEYGDSPLAGQATLGVAASLEAQGKIAEAAGRYDDYIKHHLSEPNIPQAKSALARILVAENKPEQALDLYKQLAQVNNQDSWSAEAGIQAEELLQKHPELRQKLAPPPSQMTAPPAAAPTLTIPKK